MSAKNGSLKYIQLPLSDLRALTANSEHTVFEAVRLTSEYADSLNQPADNTPKSSDDTAANVLFKSYLKPAVDDSWESLQQKSKAGKAGAAARKLKDKHR